MQSLRDKLLKAGLVSEEAAKKVETEKSTSKPPPMREARSGPPQGERRGPPPPSRRGPPPERRGPPPERRGPPPVARAEMRIPKLPPMPGSKEAHRLQSKKQVQLDRDLREMVVATEVGKEPGATTFHFVTRKNTLRRLELTEAQAKLLETGELAVVERPDPDKIDHSLVPAEVARAMAKLSPKSVRFLNDQQGSKVGFLTDEEIAARAHEVTANPELESNDAEPEAADEASPAEAEAAPAASTWVTIKRSPIA